PPRRATQFDSAPAESLSAYFRGPVGTARVPRAFAHPTNQRHALRSKSKPEQKQTPFVPAEAGIQFFATHSESAASGSPLSRGRTGDSILDGCQCASVRLVP